MSEWLSTIDCGLQPDGRIGVVSADGGLRSSDGRAEEADVTDGRWVAEQPLGEPDDVVEVEELDRIVHRPRRSMASACTSRISSDAVDTLDRCSLRAM